MGVQLRLGFAMGGGVSLGTFCGAALTESIKLALLYGKYNGQPFDSVIVDVFSGASAGALSLALMLRGLADPPADMRDGAVANLKRLHGSDFTSIPKGPRRDNLIAAQIVQDMQWGAWVREIDIVPLTGGHKEVDLERDPCLLNTGAVTDLARKWILRDFNGPNFKQRRILADRVLFACTLSNLSPVLADARKQLRTDEVGFAGLTDGMRSNVHRELRVFDLNFTQRTNAMSDNLSPRETIKEGEPIDLDNYPARWCRYDEGPEVKGVYGDLREKDTWRKIAATAIASGAFPFAFKPITLERDHWEFGKEWPAALAQAGMIRYPFTYIDGGTFNNEPIREAFRMAAFLDAQAKDKTNFVRRILFVDPFVSDEALSLRLPVTVTREMQAPAAGTLGDGYDLITRSSLDRLIPHIGTIIGAISDESRVIEADKIFQVRDSFQLRDQMRRFLAKGLKTQAPDSVYNALIKFCDEKLRVDRYDEMIPPGCLMLNDELRRVISEMSADAADPIGELAPADPDDLLKSASPSAVDPKGLWLRALTAVAVDLSMRLEGKSADSQLIAIAPFREMAKFRDQLLPAYLAEQKHYKEAFEAYKQAYAKAAAAREKLPFPPIPPTLPRPTKVDLPGGEITGFAGFFSQDIRNHDFHVGSACAREFLAACKLIDAPPAKPVPAVSWVDETQKLKMKAGMQRLMDRVEQMIERSNLLNIGWGIDKAALNTLSWIVKGQLKKLAELKPMGRSFQLRLKVPDKNLRLPQSGFNNDTGTVQEGGSHWLYLCADYLSLTDGWDCVNVVRRDGQQVIPIAKPKFAGLADTVILFVRVPGPTNGRPLPDGDLYANPTLRAEITAAQLKAGGTVTLDWTSEAGVGGLEAEL